MKIIDLKKTAQKVHYAYTSYNGLKYFSKYSLQRESMFKIKWFYIIPQRLLTFIISK